MTFKNKIVLFDLDGCLAEGESFTPQECEAASVSKAGLAKYLKVWDEARFVVIYTARRDECMPATIRWLRNNHIPYHAISNLKAPTDVYIDDKAINIKDL